MAPRRLTSATMTAGVLLSALCFLVAVAAEVGGASATAGEMTDFAAVLDGLAAFRPWAWASLGVYVVVATPVLALLASAAEYARVADWETVGLAALVLGVLSLSFVVAVLR